MYLGTWKQRIIINQDKKHRLPGLFQSAHFGIQAILFCIMLALETIGTVQLATSSKTAPIWSIFFVILDFAFAIIAQIPRQKLANGALEVAKTYLQMDPRTGYDLRKEINKRKKFQRILEITCWAIIIGSACAKIYFFYVNKQAVFLRNPKYFYGIAAIYIVSALIHIIATGSFVWECFIRIITKSNHRRYQQIVHLNEGEGIDEKPKNTARLYRLSFSLDHPLDNFEIDRFTLTREKNGGYTLSSKGVLWDSDILEIISAAVRNMAAEHKNGKEAQSAEIDLRWKMALRCLELQMQILISEPEGYETKQTQSPESKNPIEMNSSITIQNDEGETQQIS